MKDRSKNNWVFDGKPLNMTYKAIEELDLFGFVYLIVDNTTQKRYIGKKSFHKFTTPKGGKRKKRTESNWKEYPSSNAELKSAIGASEEKNRDFSFVVLALCKDKSILSYEETKQVLRRGAIESSEYYNGNVQIKLFAKHLDYSDRVYHSFDDVLLGEL